MKREQQAIALLANLVRFLEKEQILVMYEGSPDAKAFEDARTFLNHNRLERLVNMK